MLGNPSPITDASNTSPIIVTTALPVAFPAGSSAFVAGVGGNNAANGTWPVSVIDPTHFSLTGSAGSGAYAGGGLVRVVTAQSSASGGTANLTSDPAEAYVASIRGIVRQEIAAKRYGPFEYVVQAAHADGTVNITPADDGMGLPNFTNLTMWPGFPGSTVQPAAGTHLAIVFLDGNRGKPIAIGAFDVTPSTKLTVVAESMLLGDSLATPVAHASWLSDIQTALETFAGAMSTAATLGQVIAAGTALQGALQAIEPSPTAKVSLS